MVTRRGGGLTDSGAALRARAVDDNPEPGVVMATSISTPSAARSDESVSLEELRFVCRGLQSALREEALAGGALDRPTR